MNEAIRATLPAGTNCVRIQAREEGDNTYVFRYGVGDADPDEVARLEAERNLGPAMRVEDAEAYEGAETGVRFRVTLDEASESPVTVRYRTADGTAKEREDYEAASGLLTFAAGETEQGVEVAVIDDTTQDSGETFTLHLSDPSGAWLADGEAVGTILNLEPMVQSVSEAEGEDLPAGTITTGVVTVGGSATGNIGAGGDRDWFAVTLKADTRYRIDLEGSPTSQGALDDS